MLVVWFSYKAITISSIFYNTWNQLQSAQRLCTPLLGLLHGLQFHGIPAQAKATAAVAVAAAVAATGHRIKSAPELTQPKLITQRLRHSPAAPTAVFFVSRAAETAAENSTKHPVRAAHTHTQSRSLALTPTLSLALTQRALSRTGNAPFTGRVRVERLFESFLLECFRCAPTQSVKTKPKRKENKQRNKKKENWRTLLVIKTKTTTANTTTKATSDILFYGFQNKMATMSPAATTATTALSYVELCALSCVAAAAKVCLTFRILMYVAQLQLFKCLTHTHTPTHMHYLPPSHSSPLLPHSASSSRP